MFTLQTLKWDSDRTYFGWVWNDGEAWFYPFIWQAKEFRFFGYRVEPVGACCFGFWLFAASWYW